MISSSSKPVTSFIASFAQMTVPCLSVIIIPLAADSNAFVCNRNCASTRLRSDTSNNSGLSSK